MSFDVTAGPFIVPTVFLFVQCPFHGRVRASQQCRDPLSALHQYLTCEKEKNDT
jgi:hypothetical protein